MPEAQHPNLSGAFAPPAKRDRAASLAGLLPPKREPAPALEQAAERESDSSTTEPAPRQGSEGTSRRPRRASAPARQPAVAENPDRIVNLPVYLPTDLLAELQAHTPRGTTYADVLLEAFEGVGEDRLKDYFTPRPRTSASGMPLAPQTANPGSGPQRQFRVRRAQLRWIEDLATRVDAPNRSVLCVAALRLHLQDRATS